MLSSADVQRRLLAALAEPAEGSEGRKRVLLDCLRILGREGVRHAIAGDLALWLRAMRPASMRLELAVGSLSAVPWGALQAEGFAVGRTSCSRQGASIRFRAVRPAALARAETFGKLAVLGASDLLAGKLADANAHWMPPQARRRAVDEAARLVRENTEAADDVAGAIETLREAREKMTKWKGIPMEKKTTRLQSLVGVAKELFALFGVLALLAGCDGAAGGEGTDGGGLGEAGGQVTPVTGAACQGGTLCPIGLCAVGPSYTSTCCNGCSGTSGCQAFGTFRNVTSTDLTICTIGSGGPSFASVMADPHCTGCYEITKCGGTGMPYVDSCGICHPVGAKLSYLTSPYAGSAVTRTLTCVSSSSGPTWR
jgi:hypothetical protein